jgi:hypothetical protein
VHVIRHQMPFLDHALSLLRQPSEHFAQLLPDRSKYRLLPILRDENNVILTLPTTVI